MTAPVEHHRERDHIFESVILADASFSVRTSRDAQHIICGHQWHHSMPTSSRRIRLPGLMPTSARLAWTWPHQSSRSTSPTSSRSHTTAAAYCHFGAPYTKDGRKFFEWENTKDLFRHRSSPDVISRLPCRKKCSCRMQAHTHCFVPGRVPG